MNKNKFESFFNNKYFNIARLATGAVLLLLGLTLHIDDRASTVIFSLSLFIIGYPMLVEAVKGFARKEFLDENTLMIIASVGAFVLGEYPEGIAVLLLSQIGEMFEEYAVNKSRDNITSLMALRPDSATVLRDGEWVIVSPEKVELEDKVLVKVGERVPVDGVVTEGNSSLDISSLTGESLPMDVKTGDKILSGSIVLTSELHIKANKIFSESTASKVLDLVENASLSKAKSEKFITKFAKWYTPVVVASAVLLAVIPGIITSDWKEWIYRALMFLVVSCPCALVISVPLAYFSGIGKASKKGILIKGSEYVDRLAKADALVTDKTGTLTKANFVVEKVISYQITSEDLLKIALSAESGSPHPIALAIKSYAEKAGIPYVEGLKEEKAGYGIILTLDNQKYFVGNRKLLIDNNIQAEDVMDAGSCVYIADSQRALGLIIVSDEIKPEAKEALEELRALGVNRSVMLSGDKDAVCGKVAAELNITEKYSELLPQEKLDKLKAILAEQKEVMYVGDGINDAPSLATADIGIAMGGIGSDLAIDSADVVIMRDELTLLPQAITISRKTKRKVWQNIIFALGIKALILILSALGITTMWWAIFADVGVTVLAVLNSFRK